MRHSRQGKSMTNQNNAAQPVLTDDEILAATLYGQSEARMIRNGRAIESALLSKLRAEGVQAGDERAKLPPLPEPRIIYNGEDDIDEEVYDGDQMKEYARAAVLADRQRYVNTPSADVDIDRQQRAGDGQVYGPYRVKWIGAGVWAGITDELPGELEGKDVFIRAALSATQAEQGERDGDH
jgi:hypothetical protein